MITITFHSSERSFKLKTYEKKKKIEYVFQWPESPLDRLVRMNCGYVILRKHDFQDVYNDFVRKRKIEKSSKFIILIADFYIYKYYIFDFILNYFKCHCNTFVN